MNPGLTGAAASAAATAGAVGGASGAGSRLSEPGTGIDMPPEGGRTGEFFKEKLLRDSEKVTERDVEGLGKSVPKKLEGLDTGVMADGMKWINTLIDRVRTLYAMIRDKDYTITTKTKGLIAAALLYFVLPTDLTPDFIPGIGYIDDAMVLSMLWKLIGEEVERYVQSSRRLFPE